MLAKLLHISYQVSLPKMRFLQIKCLSQRQISTNDPDSKAHGANMGPTWVLSAPDGPHVGPMNLAIRETIETVSPEGTFCDSVQVRSGPGDMGLN